MTKQTALVKSENPHLALLERALTDTNCDPAKLEHLLKVKKEWEADESLKLFNTALHGAQSKMPIVVRDAKNDHIGNRYATLEAVAKTIKGVYRKHGFSITFSEEPCDRDEYLLIVATVRHIGNHIENYRRFAPIDDKGPKGSSVKTKLHGCQSTMSYMQRQLLCSIFDVTIADEDNDGNEPIETLTDSQIDEIEKYLSELPDETRANVLKFTGVDTVDLMPAKYYEVTVKKLKATLEAKGDAN